MAHLIQQMMTRLIIFALTTFAKTENRPTFETRLDVPSEIGNEGNDVEYKRSFQLIGHVDET